MTREEAIEILEDVVEWSDFEGYWPEKQEKALRFAIAALRGPAWVRTSERVPAEADTGDDGKILCVTVGLFFGTVILHVFWGIVAEHPERYPYWMPMPKLPEEDEL